MPARLLLSLDELTNIAPLPSLESIISQGAGQGVLACWAVQSHAQLRQRYGDHAAEAIWSATRCKIVFGGLADAHSLEQLSRMIGDHRVRTRSTTDDFSGVRVSRSWEWRPRVSPAELRRLPPKWALLLYHDRKPYALRAPVAARRWRMRRAFMPWRVPAPAPSLRLHAGSRPEDDVA
jgi:type IV secretory pathway TraG/TraD family ATPase VirD4